MNNVQFHLGKKKTACQNSDRNPEKTRVSGGEVCTNCLFKRRNEARSLSCPFTFLSSSRFADWQPPSCLAATERCCNQAGPPVQVAQHQPVFLTQLLYTHLLMENAVSMSLQLCLMSVF